MVWHHFIEKVFHLLLSYYSKHIKHIKNEHVYQYNIYIHTLNGPTNGPTNASKISCYTK